jgi:hypothetical protein
MIILQNVDLSTIEKMWRYISVLSLFDIFYCFSDGYRFTTEF